MKAYILPASILTLAVALVAAVFMFNSQSAVGSVIQGQEYKMAQITAAGTTTPKFTFGSIGQIIVASSSATDIKFYDIASTTATTSASLFLTLDGTIAEGSYTFDVEFTKGLYVEALSGYNGDIIITYR